MHDKDKDKDKDSVELPCNEPRNDFTLAMLIRLGRVKRESPLAMGDYYLDARRTPKKSQPWPPVDCGQRRGPTVFCSLLSRQQINCYY